MIQDRNGQGAVFDPKQGFVESAGPCDPRSLVLYASVISNAMSGSSSAIRTRHPVSGPFMDSPIGAAKAGLPGQRGYRFSEVVVGVDESVYECKQETRCRLRIALLLGGRPASHVFDLLASHVFQLAGLVDGFVTHLARLLLGAHVSRPFRGFETWRRLELLL